jgi:ribosomal protein L11 methylase PrmA
MSKDNRIAASFRDPSGFLFRRDDVIYRQVNCAYQENYTRLMGSGLYDSLVADGLLIPHEEVNVEPVDVENAYKVVRPERVPFIAYPYEWCFSQLKDAALLTLEVQKRAISFGMSLKDASAYNVQFLRGRPVLIDSLSFEIYPESKPWVAYRQFCQHFLAPLALVAHRDIRLSQLMRIYIDGLPLDLASELLPARTRLDFGLLTHIHLHAAAQTRYAQRALNPASLTRRVSKNALLGLVDSLESTTRKLSWKPGSTEWVGYYAATNYSEAALAHKRQIVAEYIERTNPSSVWDLGANTGLFSRLASQSGVFTIAFDADYAAVEQNYRSAVTDRETNLLPLVMDLTNPSASIGWHNRERQSLLQRGPVDAVLALALVHHLAISNNTPLSELAEFFADITHWLIIEFVPKEDSQVQRLLATRVDIFPDYHQAGFERAFGSCFTVRDSSAIRDSLRWLYLMEKR